jgi:hypothetical protein
LQDYDAALVARGFDGYQPTERYQMINMGYRYIARKNTSSWEQSAHVYVVNPGDPPITVAGASGLGADNISQAAIVSSPYQRKLRVMRQEVFEEEWLPGPTKPGTPRWYYVFEGYVFILPQPNAVMSIEIWYQQFLPDMVALTDVPVTPQIYDEVILDAALVRAHRRAHELELAGEAQGRINEALQDILADDVWTMAEQQERVLPDDQWL